MILNIEREHRRFREIVRKSIRKDLKRFILHGELIGRRGKDLVSIPVPQILLPSFRYGKNLKGVGSGEGAPGTPLGREEGEGRKGAGNRPGEHILEVEISLDELADMLGEELALPRIEPKGRRRFVVQRKTYSRISRKGPESLRHFKRTFLEALKREIASQDYDASNPVVLPVKEDRRYLYGKEDEEPDVSAVIIYMMDVSGSMGDAQKEIVRTLCFWIDTWIQRHYRNLERRYIIHDAQAKEVDRDTFYRVKESGGTLISSAYSLCSKIIEDDYPPAEWNIYPFHFSDGDNWSGGDTSLCLEILEKRLLPKVNLFCYTQVYGDYGSGDFIKEMEKVFGGKETLISEELKEREEVLRVMKKFLARGV